MTGRPKGGSANVQPRGILSWNLASLHKLASVEKHYLNWHLVLPFDIIIVVVFWPKSSS
jgi:hypothetical protein